MLEKNLLWAHHGLLWLLKTPLQQDYRITSQGIARRDGTSWQMLPGKSAGAEQNRLFLAVLQGDSSGLQRDFDLQLQGEPAHWTLTLTPRATQTAQFVRRIALAGGRHLDEIRLEEAGGDVTTLSFSHTRLADALSPEESRLLTTP